MKWCGVWSGDLVGNIKRLTELKEVNISRWEECMVNLLVDI